MADNQNDITEKLLSDGLDLCCRARELDVWHDEGLRAEMGERGLSRSGTPAMWLRKQYDEDLKCWEAKARKHLSSLDGWK